MAEHTEKISDSLVLDYIKKKDPTLGMKISKKWNAPELPPGSPDVTEVVTHFLKTSQKKRRQSLDLLTPGKTSKKDKSAPKTNGVANGTPKSVKTNGHAKDGSENSSEESSDESDEPKKPVAAKKTPAKSPKAVRPTAPVQQDSSSEESSSEEEEKPASKKVPAKVTPKQAPKKESSSEEDSSDDEPAKKPQPKAQKVVTKAAAKKESSSSEEDSSEEEPPKKQQKSPAKVVKPATKKESSSEEESSDDEEPPKAKVAPKQAPKVQAKAAAKESSDDSDSSEEESDEAQKKPIAKKSVPVKAPAKASKSSSSAESSSDEEEQAKPVAKKVVAKKVAKKESSSSEDSSDDEDEQPPKKVIKKDAKKESSSEESDDEEEKATPAAPVAGEKRKRESEGGAEFGNRQKFIKADAAMNGDSGESESYELFVNRIGFSMTEDQLYEHFKQFGTVERTKVVTDRESGQSRGFAFVTFSSPAEAKAAVSHGFSHMIEDVECQVRLSEPKPMAGQQKFGGNNSFGGGNNSFGGGNDCSESKELFVNRLDYSFTDDHLFEYFKQFGTVERARVAIDKESGSSRGFAFITFTSPDEAKAAVAKGQTHSIEGSEFCIRLAEPKNNDGGQQFAAMQSTQRRKSEPFRRVREEEVTVDPRFTNAFTAKRDAAGDWGYRAHKDLINTRGKGFRHEKNKKKKGSYSGGSISTAITSIKFD